MGRGRWRGKEGKEEGEKNRQSEGNEREEKGKRAEGEGGGRLYLQG